MAEKHCSSMTEQLEHTHSIADVARYTDVEDLSNILLLANRASAEHNGQPTWPFVDIALEHLERDIQNGEVYCLRSEDDTPYASVAINLEDKKNLWPNETKDIAAVYFSKLMKNPSVSTPDVMKTLFEQIIETARQHNTDVIRCDAVASNERLLAYYTRLGFHSRGRVPYPYPGDTREAALLETTAEELEAAFSL